MTKPEEQLKSALESLEYTVKPYKNRKQSDPIDCIYMQMPIGLYRCDFASPHVKIVIEVDGDYWHGKRSSVLTAAQLLKKAGDEQKERILRKMGWEVFRITASSISNKKRLSYYLEDAFDPKRRL